VASSWGNSWGAAWGNSWGPVGVIPEEEASSGERRLFLSRVKEEDELIQKVVLAFIEHLANQ